MSIARVRSFAFSGIEAVPVEVQVQIAGGLPAFLIVGLPDKTVGEARERARATLTAMGLALPPKRVLINLAPASLLKEGSHFDLPIALCLLAAMDVLPREEIGGYAALGELSLDGSLLPVPGVLPAAMGASELDLGLICPVSQGGEAAWVGRIEVLASPDLLGILNHFRGQQVLAPPQPAGLMESLPSPDLSDIRGLETARRALEISAAGSHNLLMIGPPGAGKSMLASRLPGLLPDLTPSEALEVSMVHSVAGLLQGGRLVMRPPFREPHHSASQAALSGGGCQFHQLDGININCLDSISTTIAGEAALAHLGNQRAVDDLDNVLACGRVVPAWSKAGGSISTRPIVIVSLDAPPSALPSDATVHRLAGFAAIMATIDPVPPEARGRLAAGESSSTVAARVRLARRRACTRQSVPPSKADPCLADEPDGSPADRLIGDAAECFGLDARNIASVGRVARTIADLAGSLRIERQHAAEALWLRPRLACLSSAA